MRAGGDDTTLVAMDELLERACRQLGADPVKVAALSGGDVCRVERADLADGRRVVIKTHRSPRPDFFTTEAVDLQWLDAAEAVAVPDVLAVSDTPGGAFLALEWIEATGTPAGDGRFGAQLADLHLSGADCFGRSDGRLTTSHGLGNRPTDTWAEFFATQRLEPLLAKAFAHGLDERIGRDLDRVIDRLELLVGDPEPPARLHGDLWAGNRLVDASGASWLIDPACLGGHREFDLAMMQLFGGFSDRELATYGDVHPLAEGWSERVALHQLPPLLSHAIKFGGSYVAALDRAAHQLL